MTVDQLPQEFVKVSKQRNTFSFTTSDLVRGVGRNVTIRLALLPLFTFLAHTRLWPLDQAEW